MLVMVTELVKLMCDVPRFKPLASLLYTLEAVIGSPKLVRQDVHSV